MHHLFGDVQNQPVALGSARVLRCAQPAASLHQSLSKIGQEALDCLDALFLLGRRLGQVLGGDLVELPPG